MQNHQNNLVEDNLNLVYYIVSHNFPTYLKDEDVIQAGMEGLCKAAKTYNSDKGKFSTFAGVCIRRHIYKELNRRKVKSAHWKMLSLEMKTLTFSKWNLWIY